MRFSDLYRLTGQQKLGQTCTYTLDGVGNLKTMWEGGLFPKTFTHNAADRLVTMVEGQDLTSYTYTGYGALASAVTGNSTTNYSYSGQDQLIAVTPPVGIGSTYTFGGDGLRRTAQEGNVLPTTMVWDGSDYLLLNGPTSNRIVLTLDSEIVACGGIDLLTDPLGSLVKEISVGASLGNLMELYPYGTQFANGSRPSTPFIYIAAYGYYFDTGTRIRTSSSEYFPALGLYDHAVGRNTHPTIRTAYRLSTKAPCGDCGTTHEKICKWAEGLKGFDDPGKDQDLFQFLGKVVCCKGEAYSCAWISVPSPGIKKCILEHEQTHAEDFTCTGDGFLEATNSREGWKSECFAYRKSISCLDAVCDKDPYFNWCLRSLCEACKAATVYCSAAGIPLPDYIKDICKRRKC